MKKIFTRFGIIMIMVLSMCSMAYAQSTEEGNGTEGGSQTVRPPIAPGDFTPDEPLLIPNAAGSDAPQEQLFGGRFLPAITNAIIALAGGFAFVFMIVGGIQILTAYGNEERVSAGKKTMTYAIVGLLVAILSYAIVSIISAINLTPQQGNQQQGQEENDATNGNTNSNEEIIDET